MIRQGQTDASADELHGFIDHESEHEERRGSDTLVVRCALNDSTPQVEGILNCRQDPST
jgi:hypothetical protein